MSRPTVGVEIYALQFTIYGGGDKEAHYDVCESTVVDVTIRLVGVILRGIQNLQKQFKFYRNNSKFTWLVQFNGRERLGRDTLWQLMRLRRRGRAADEVGLDVDVGGGGVVS